VGDPLALISVEFTELLVFRLDRMSSAGLLEKHIFKSEDLVSDRNDFLLHRFYLLVEGGDLGSVLRSHGHLPVARLLHNQVLLLDVLQLLRLSLLLELGHLTATVLNLAFLLL